MFAIPPSISSLLPIVGEGCIRLPGGFGRFGEGLRAEAGIAGSLGGAVSLDSENSSGKARTRYDPDSYGAPSAEELPLPAPGESLASPTWRLEVGKARLWGDRTAGRHQPGRRGREVLRQGGRRLQPAAPPASAPR